MYSTTLNTKPEYTNDNGDVLINLARSIFINPSNRQSVGDIFRIPRDYEMRPDLISRTSYGTDDYGDIILKNSNIDNPFSLDYNDVVVIAHLQNIDDNIVTPEDVNFNKSKDLLKNYHKYIDKSKVPEMVGSQKNNVKTEEYIEPNYQKSGDSGIKVVDGKIYFGDVPASKTTEENGCVDRKQDGVSLGAFLTTVLKNNK